VVKIFACLDLEQIISFLDKALPGKKYIARKITAKRKTIPIGFMDGNLFSGASSGRIILGLRNGD
jgi:hypothetical protein